MTVPTAVPRGASALAVHACGLDFRNPLLLAAGTAAYGRELEGVVGLDRVGGLVTKAVSVEPRKGAPAPRVAEFPGGMINAVGLANPGLEEVRREQLPWLATHLAGLRKIVNVVGSRVEDFAAVVRGLEEAFAPGSRMAAAIDAFELNVSCPNVKAGGLEFGADPVALRDVIVRARAETTRPLFVKLSPTLPDVAGAARAAVDAGADALTLVNTLPGLLVDVERRRPVLGFGSGGVSGPALLPVGLLATWRVSRAVRVPIVGVGGVASATDVVAYLMAGASLVGIGTAAMRDPRAPERIVADLATWMRAHGVASAAELTGTLEWPA
jgi:dihydroorotate dehydrogenase (NAD+) catalytic subunit